MFTAAMCASIVELASNHRTDLQVAAGICAFALLVVMCALAIRDEADA